MDPTGVADMTDIWHQVICFVGPETNWEMKWVLRPGASGFLLRRPDQSLVCFNTLRELHRWAEQEGVGLQLPDGKGL